MSASLCETPCPLCLCGKAFASIFFTTEAQRTRSFTEKFK